MCVHPFMSGAIQQTVILYAIMLGYIPPVNQVETLALGLHGFVLMCIGDLNSAK